MLQVAWQDLEALSIRSGSLPIRKGCLLNASLYELNSTSYFLCIVSVMLTRWRNERRIYSKTGLTPSGSWGCIAIFSSCLGSPNFKFKYQYIQQPFTGRKYRSGFLHSSRLTRQLFTIVRLDRFVQFNPVFNPQTSVLIMGN